MQFGSNTRNHLVRLLLTIAALVLGSSLVTAQQPVVVPIIASSTGAHVEWQAEMFDAFHAAHPDIRIELLEAPGGAVQRMLTLLAAGVPPGLSFNDPTILMDWAKKGIVEDLAPYLARSEVLNLDWYAPAFDIFRMGDAVYGVPTDLQIGGVFYNKLLFDLAGLAYPTERWTYADLLENAKKFLELTPDGKPLRHGFKLPTNRNWVPIVWAHGGDFFDDWTNPTQFTGRTPQTLAGLEYLHELVASQAVQDRTTHASVAAGPAFMQQRIAMVLSNTITLASFTQIQDFEWDVIPLPTGPDGNRVPYMNAIGWFLFKDFEHKEAAWKVLEFLNSYEAQLRKVEITGNVPASMELIRTKWMERWDNLDSRLLLLTDLSQGRSPQTLSSELWPFVERDALAAIWGDLPVPSAIEEIDRLVTNYLKGSTTP